MAGKGKRVSEQLRRVWPKKLNPAKLGKSRQGPIRRHLTVPKDFRPSVIPKSVVLHRESRDEAEISEWEGLRVVRPFRAVLDLIREGRVSTEHIERGFKDGVGWSIITIVEVKKMKLPPNERRLIDAWLKEAA